ncbi:MAG TPA: hypothetical protein VNQ76_05220 [Planctomicrobium sp.]|nr:hypothetical protein [Planctomicrobium sp.]
MKPLVRIGYWHLLAVLSVAMMVVWGCGANINRMEGVVGKISVNGQPLPAQTQVLFYAVDGDENFVSLTKPDGTYRYVPHSLVAIHQGKYKVVLAPPPSKAIERDGIAVEDPNSVVVNLNVDPKYLSKETTPLEVDLSESLVTFDIDL